MPKKHIIYDEDGNKLDEYTELTNAEKIIGVIIFFLLVLACFWSLLTPLRNAINLNSLLPTETPEIYVVSTPLSPTGTPEIYMTSTLLPPTATPNVQFIILSDGSEVTMVKVPARTFVMGNNNNDSSDEQPEHEIYLDEFLIGQTETTNKMYATCVEAGICNSPTSVGSYSRTSYYGNPTFDNYPVIFVSWPDAVNYCTWIGGALPTEAQWEKAARGIDARTYPWGDGEPTCNLANFYGCQPDTTEVGSYPMGISPYGALDMAGNVWEWVNDWYSVYYAISPSENPTGPSIGEFRVRRGGAWNHSVDGLYTTNRDSDFEGLNYDGIGFRCVISPNYMPSLAPSATASLSPSDNTTLATITPDNLAIYVDETAGIGFQYPTNWYVENFYGGIIVMTHPGIGLNPSNQGEASLFIINGDISNFDPPLIDNSPENLAIQTFENLANNPRIINGPTSLTINGYNASQIIFETENAIGKTQFGLLTAISYDNYGAIILSISLKEDEMMYRPIMENIINSIELSAPETLENEGTLSYGVSAFSSVSANGPSTWLFDGSAGDVIDIIVDPTDNNLDVVVNVLTSDGTSILPNPVDNSFGTEQIIGLELPISDQYLVVISGFAGSFGNYSITLSLSSESASSIKTTFILGYSTRGNALNMTQIGNGPNKIILIGGLHGNEPASVELVSRLKDYFYDQAELVPSTYALYFLPIFNPDALAEGSRYTPGGVDFNRNWDTPSWLHNAPEPGGIKNGSGGAYPFSEPETLSLSTWLLDLQSQPGTQSIAVIFYHHHIGVSEAGDVMPGYINYGDPDYLSYIMAITLSNAGSYSYLPTWIGNYQPTGEAINWCAIQGFSAVDIELPPEGYPDEYPSRGNYTILQSAINSIIALFTN